MANPEHSILAPNAVLNQTVTILATDKAWGKGDPANECSRCHGFADEGKLAIVVWKQSAFVYCKECRKRMGI